MYFAVITTSVEWVKIGNMNTASLIAEKGALTLQNDNSLATLGVAPSAPIFTNQAQPVGTAVVMHFPGNPDPRHISTSLVERQNWTVRTTLRRYTRLSKWFLGRNILLLSRSITSRTISLT